MPAEVFGEGDPARRRAAIEELYTEDCTVLLPIGCYVGRAALDQVAGELRASHPSFVYTASPAAGRSERRAPRMGLRAARQAAALHRARCHSRARREVLRSLCLPRLAACMMAEFPGQTQISESVLREVCLTGFLRSLIPTPVRRARETRPARNWRIPVRP